MQTGTVKAIAVRAKLLLPPKRMIPVIMPFLKFLEIRLLRIKRFYARV